VRLLKVELRNGNGRPSTTLMTGRPASFCFYINKVRPKISCAVMIYNHQGLPVTFFNSAVQGYNDSYDPDVGGKFICAVDELMLVPGRYRMNVAITSNGELQDHVEGVTFFDIEQGQLGGRPIGRANTYGSVCMHHRWTVPNLG
jgi:lipopolysaccharide transport system ATP-binding protein